MIKRVAPMLLWLGLFAAPVSAADTDTAAALARFIAETLTNSPQARLLDAANATAAAQRQAAAQPLYNPELELEGERGSDTAYGIGLTQTIDWSDKRKARAEQARHGLDATRAQWRLGRETLAADLLEALADRHGAAELTALAERRHDAMRQFRHIAEQRQAAGDLDQNEYELARLAAVEASLQLSERTMHLDRAENRLRELSATPGPDDAWPALPPTPPENTAVLETDIDRLIEHHPAWRRADAELAASRGGIELARREARADPSVGLRLGRDADDSVTGLTLALPLHLRNRYQAEIAAASSEARAAAERRALTRLQLRQRLLSAQRQYRLALDGWRQWQKAGEGSLARRSALLERLWQQGELSTTDYLVQLQQTLDTQAAAVELRSRLWRAWITWLRASAGTLHWLGLEPVPSSNESLEEHS